MDPSRFAPRLFMLIPLAAVFVALPMARAVEGSGTAVEEYCRRVASIRPDDPDAWLELGRWCRSEKLEREATQAFHRALAIAPDHADAHAELGHVREGLEWRDPRASGPADKATEDAVEAAVAASTNPFGIAPPEATSEPASPAADASSGATTGEVESQDAGSAAIARKKEWARAASEAFRAEFAELETDDFLIYTTFASTREPKVREFLGVLNAARNELGKFLGTRPGGLWPEKLQFVVLRSPEELGRFAEIVDGRALSGDSAGGYVVDGERVVLADLASPLIATTLAEAALGKNAATGRPVGWWLSEGTGELLAAQIDARLRDGKLYRDTFLYAADALRAEGDALSIYSLVETPDYRPRERALKRSLAMTLVDVLIQARKYRSLLSELRSERAPAPPPGDDEEARKTYNLEYWRFQQERLRAAFGDLERLQSAWKSYVAQKAESLREADPRPPRRRGGRQR